MSRLKWMTGSHLGFLFVEWTTSLSLHLKHNYLVVVHDTIIFNVVFKMEMAEWCFVNDIHVPCLKSRDIGIVVLMVFFPYSKLTGYFYEGLKALLLLVYAFFDVTLKMAAWIEILMSSTWCLPFMWLFSFPVTKWRRGVWPSLLWQALVQYYQPSQRYLNGICQTK